MGHKWHHIVVSVLCVFAVAVVVCSLVSTFNSIHNMKKKRKRDIEKRSIHLEDSSIDFNVMEINQDMHDPAHRSANIRISDAADAVDFMSESGGDNGKVKYLAPLPHNVAKNLTLTKHSDSEGKHLNGVFGVSKSTPKSAERFFKSTTNLGTTPQMTANNKSSVKPLFYDQSPSSASLLKASSKSNLSSAVRSNSLSKSIVTNTRKPSSKSSSQNQQIPKSLPRKSKAPLKTTSKNGKSPTSTNNKLPIASTSKATKGNSLIQTTSMNPNVPLPSKERAAPAPSTSTFDYVPKTDHGEEVPIFPTDYHASGILILPRSGIAEPFEIWYAPSVDKSRIDYYYGTDKTFQRGDLGDYGVAYKYVPMYNDVNKSFDGCWSVKGREEKRIVPQVITPNMTWFKYNKTEVYTGTLATKWTYHYTAYGMKNFQSVWVTKAKPHRPIRYEMFGFDMMLGSYYDNYVIEYISFDLWDGQQRAFEVPKNIQCFEWGNSLEAAYIINPMSEFAAFSADSAVDHTKRYKEFKEKHSDDKKSSVEHIRKHVFKDNARYINSHNRRNLPFKLKANQFADKLDEELSVMHSSLEKDPKNHKGAKPLSKVNSKKTSSLHISSDTPEELDWRDFGAVTAVKGQGICGSCYAFSASEATEGAWYRKTGKKVDLSTQQLIDCSWGMGNHGCKGGHYAGALSWIYLHGISTAKSYGKYLGQEGYCHFNDTWFGANIDGFFYVPVWNKTALKRAVAMHGPVAVSINTRPLSFKFYSHGIYNDPVCEKNKTTHSALVIGYGKKYGKEYWIIKNSWSDLWGENGFMRISMDNDLCGITEYPVAVIVNNPSFVFPRKAPISPSDNGFDKTVSSPPKEKKKPNIALEPMKQTDLELKKHSKMTGSTESKDKNIKLSDEDNPQADENHNIDENTNKIKKTSKSKGAENKTVPFSGLHISGLNEDLKRFKEIFSDDTPEVFEAYNDETQDITNNSINSGNNNGNNIATNVNSNKINAGNIISNNNNNVGNINMNNNNNNMNNHNIDSSTNVNSNNNNNNKIINTGEKIVNSNKFSNSLLKIGNNNVSNVKNDGHPNNKIDNINPNNNHYANSNSYNDNKLKTGKILSNNNKSNSANIGNQSNNNNNNNINNIDSNNMNNNGDGQNLQQNGRLHPNHKEFQQLSKEEVKKLLTVKPLTASQKQRAEKFKNKHKNKKIKTKKLGSKNEKSRKAYKSNEESLNDIIKTLDDVQLSNENTEHSNDNLIKTHKHSNRLRLNPENIGSLDIGNESKQKPDKATEQQDKKATVSVNPVVAHAQNKAT